MLLFLDREHQQFSENSIVWNPFFLTWSFPVMPWEYIGGGLPVFPPTNTNPSSLSGSLWMPGHFGFGRMAPASKGCLSWFGIQGVHLQCYQRGSHAGGFLQLPAAVSFLFSCPLKGSSWRKKLPAQPLPAGAHPRSQIPAPFHQLCS